MCACIWVCERLHMKPQHFLSEVEINTFHKCSISLTYSPHSLAFYVLPHIILNLLIQNDGLYGVFCLFIMYTHNIQIYFYKFPFCLTNKNVAYFRLDRWWSRTFSVYVRSPHCESFVSTGFFWMLRYDINSKYVTHLHCTNLALEKNR